MGGSLSGRADVPVGTANGNANGEDASGAPWVPHSPANEDVGVPSAAALTFPLFINGDGSQRRDLTHVSDVVRAVEMALRWQGGGSVALNVGTGQNHSVLDRVAAAENQVRQSHAALHFSGPSFQTTVCRQI